MKIDWSQLHSYIYPNIIQIAPSEYISSEEISRIYLTGILTEENIGIAKLYLKVNLISISSDEIVNSITIDQSNKVLSFSSIESEEHVSLLRIHQESSIAKSELPKQIDVTSIARTFSTRYKVDTDYKYKQESKKQELQVIKVKSAISNSKVNLPKITLTLSITIKLEAIVTEEIVNSLVIKNIPPIDDDEILLFLFAA